MYTYIYTHKRAQVIRRISALIAGRAANDDHDDKDEDDAAAAVILFSVDFYYRIIPYRALLVPCSLLLALLTRELSFPFSLFPFSFLSVSSIIFLSSENITTFFFFFSIIFLYSKNSTTL